MRNCDVTLRLAIRPAPMAPWHKNTVMRQMRKEEMECTEKKKHHHLVVHGSYFKCPFVYTPECRTIIQCTSELTTALKSDIISLSRELIAAGLISDDNAAALRNQFIGEAHRAAQLVGLVRNRVSLDTANYHSFIRVLKQRQDDHKDILRILYKKYRELGAYLMPTSYCHLAKLQCLV